MRIDRDTFIDLIKQNVPDGKLAEITAATCLTDVGIDSLGFATLLFALEDKFETQIDEKHLEGLNGLSTVAQFIGTFRKLGFEIEI